MVIFEPNVLPAGDNIIMNNINFNFSNSQIINSNSLILTGWGVSLMDKFNFNTSRGKVYVRLLSHEMDRDSFLNIEEKKRLHCGIIVDFSSVTYGLFKETTREEAIKLNTDEYKKLIENYIPLSIIESIPYINVKDSYSVIIVDYLKREISIFGLINTRSNQ